jgi:hypothetical protein
VTGLPLPGRCSLRRHRRNIGYFITHLTMSQIT